MSPCLPMGHPACGTEHWQCMWSGFFFFHYGLCVSVKRVYSRDIGPSPDLTSTQLDSCPALLIWGNESQAGPSALLGGEDDVQPRTYSLGYQYKPWGGGRGDAFCQGGLNTRP